MSTRLVRAAFAALLLLLVVACNKQEPAAPASAAVNTPDGAIQKTVALLKQGDVAGLMQNALPPADFAQLKADWGKDDDQKPITDEDRQKFQETMAKLTAPDADKTLYAEIEPQLQAFDAQYQQQLPMYVAMGSGWLQGMVQQNKDMSEAEKTQAVAAINALAGWVQKTHFTDPESIKKVIAIATKAARDLNLKTLDEARALNFDQSMQKAHIAFVAVKEALSVYGFSIDQTLDSVKTEVASNDGKNSSVKVTYSLLGTPLTANAEMVNVDGHWYGKHTIEQLQEQKQQAAQQVAPAVEAAPAAETPAPGN